MVAAKKSETEKTPGESAPMVAPVAATRPAETKSAKAKVAKGVPFVLEDEGHDYVQGMNKQRTAGHVDPNDPDGKAKLPARIGGYVNQHGVFFPQGYQFKGGHISYRGHVVLVKCPKCGHRNSSDRALQGVCGNTKANEGNGCHYSPIDDLEQARSA